MAAMPADPSGGAVIQKVAVAKNTTACGFWMKGQGRLQVKILDPGADAGLSAGESSMPSRPWKAGVICTTLTPKNEALWQRMDLPVFNSGNNTAVYL